MEVQPSIVAYSSAPLPFSVRRGFSWGWAVQGEGAYAS